MEGTFKPPVASIVVAAMYHRWGMGISGATSIGKAAEGYRALSGLVVKDVMFVVGVLSAGRALGCPAWR